MPVVLSALDLSKNELQNARIQNLASAPASPVEGQIYYDTTAHVLYWRSNSAWVAATAAGGTVTGVTATAPIVSSGGTAPDISLQTGGITNTHINASAGIAYSKLTLTTSIVNGDISASAAIAYSKLSLTGSIVNADISASAAIALSKLATDPLARANHTGTQLASTISNFDTQVRTSRLDQMAAPTASVSMGSQLLTNLATPVSATDATTKAYVDGVATGLDVKSSVRVASTANITLPPGGTTLSIDGVTMANGDRVLLKNQSTGSQNGIYTVSGIGSSVVLTRATDADSSAEVTAGMFTFVAEGTTQADTGWVLTTNDAITLDTTALTFTQFSGAGAYTAGAGLTQTGTTFDVGAGTGITVNADNIQISTSYTGQTSITTLGTITTGTWTGTSIAVANGGTGGNSAATAKTNLGFMTRFAANVGDGSSVNIAVAHNLGTRDVHVQVFQNATPWAEVLVDKELTDTNTVTLKFASAPASNAYRVVVVG